ncbi:hypothetical protein ACLI4Z_13335 [Natrialbaceae archaeon A-arb3/5]
MKTDDRVVATLRDRLSTVHRIDSVEASASVRHVDQLDTDSLQAFLQCLDGDRATLADETEFEEGDVIVYTDYYRVGGY